MGFKFSLTEALEAQNLISVLVINLQGYPFSLLHSTDRDALQVDVIICANTQLSVLRVCVFFPFPTNFSLSMPSDSLCTSLRGLLYEVTRPQLDSN